jgi:hypothetical protein
MRGPSGAAHEQLVAEKAFVELEMPGLGAMAGFPAPQLRPGTTKVAVTAGPLCRVPLKVSGACR